MDSLQFPCPACDKRLRVPAAAAGQRGPCPNCGEEIIGPQPALGIPARISLQAGPPLNEIPLPPAPEANLPEPGESSPVSAALEVFQPKQATREVPRDREPPRASAEEQAPAKAPVPRPATEPALRSATYDEPAKRIRRLWAAVFVLSCILCTVLAFIGGYLTALKRIDVTAPIFAPPSTKPAPRLLPSNLPETPAPPVEIRETPSKPPIEEPPPEVDEPPSAETGSRTTLEAFLSAPDWTARSAYVAEAALPAMKEVAEAEGDGPIKVTSIEPSLLDGDLHHYRVTTEALPDGFPVTLRQTSGGWQVDWSSFHEFSTNRFARFLAGDLGESGTFRVFFKPTEDSQPAFAAYQIAAPAGTRTTTAYASRSGVAFASLTALFDSEAIANHPRYQELLQRSGLPMTVELARKTSSDGRSYLEITGLVAASWNRG
ncbi:hypothetical protein [Haloferula sp. A504]|uniref:hypothetical protein n=1 Tax=Haloferula sp. A504 TaxID=3373601 RepID=UPI0031C47367|nr:hypothetical protein [Verrucomicrobiaceae bacterium E54]